MPATMPTKTVANRPTTHPATRPGQPGLTEEQEKFLKLQSLTRQSIEFCKQKKYAEAEEVIKQALAIDPDEPTNIYNMACVKALQSHPDEAMDYLERSAENGFSDFIHIEQDTDLDSLRKLPRYKALIAAKEKYQKKDADRALAGLKKQLGEKYLYEVDTTAKLIFAANTDAQTLAAVKKWLSAQAKSQWEQLFEHHPDQYIAIVLPSSADYHKLVRMPGVEGIYMHNSRMLIAHSLGQVMTHEFTHALHAGDLDPLGQEPPIWIVEGLASLFESAQFEGEKLVPRDNFRLWVIQAAYRRKQLIPLEKLITYKQPQFMASAMLGYGESSSVLLYLYEHKLLRKFYDLYKVDYDKDPSGKTTLEQVTGQTLGEFEVSWQKWMVARKPPAFDTGRDGVYIGVQFAQTNDGLKIEQVMSKGPAEQAGVKPGDVIVGVNGMDIRDSLSFMPLLKTFKPGDRVMFKLRRGVEYLQLNLTMGHRPAPPAPATRPTTRPTARPANPAATQPTTKPVELKKAG